MKSAYNCPNNNIILQSHAQELGVLQAGLDQALMAFAQHQKNANDVSSDLSSRMERLQMDHMSELNQMLGA